MLDRIYGWMVKDQAQIEQISELERWFVSEYHDRFCSVWSKDIESNKLNELDKDKVLWILEILNKHPVNISNLTHQFRELIYVLSNMVDLSLKMKFPSLIVETLQETEGLTKAYVLFNKDIYSNEALADIQSKIQDFFALQYLGFNQYLKNFRSSLGNALEEAKDDGDSYQKILKIGEVINISLKALDHTQNNFKTILEKDFKSYASDSNTRVNFCSGSFQEALSKYLGKVAGKSKTGPYFDKDLFSYEGYTLRCEEIKKAFQRLKRQSKDEATKVKLAAYGDQYKKTLKDYARTESKLNKDDSIKSLSNQASKVSKDTIVKLLQDYLTQNQISN